MYAQMAKKTKLTMPITTRFPREIVDRMKSLEDQMGHKPADVIRFAVDLLLREGEDFADGVIRWKTGGAGSPIEMFARQAEEIIREGRTRAQRPTKGPGQSRSG